MELSASGTEWHQATVRAVGLESVFAAEAAYISYTIESASSIYYL